MGSDADEYAKFEEKVKRTVYLDNLSPVVSDSVIKAAFGQYGDVKNIHFIPNYTEPHCNSKCALVELESSKQAKAILDMLSAYPFMMAGMPRPVRGLPAEPQMFEDRPPKPGRIIQVRWLDPKDPDFEVAQELKKLAKKHVAEQSFLHKKRLEEEEKLSKQQDEALKSHYQKYDMIDSVFDGTSQRLAKRYGVHMADD
ncbi:hypothetical protein KSS87_015648 [Heliosperma pusillum]|nr:hypothetical protein KSS87_015648 [Heliosperma pusillum]